MGRLVRYNACQLLMLGVVAILAISIWTLWLGVNSDKDNVHPLLNQLIPAGHCTCKTATIFQCDSCLECPAQSSISPSSTPLSFETFDSRENSYNETQCQSFFPGLFEDPIRAHSFWQAKRGINRVDLENVQMVNGMARAAIREGHLYVLTALAKGEDHRRKILGILSSIHRALISAPELAAIPDTEFIFSVEDKLEDVAGPGHPLWVLARKADEESVWLMPDFGFWAWGSTNSNIGPYDQVVEQIRRLELPWDQKQDQLVWRGKLSFAPKLRRTLLEVARKYAWGEVKEVAWEDKVNFLSMEDHCDYKFIAHVEGRSYSASLKYRQACQSVVVIHELQYIQHHHYLLVSSGPYQNVVQVKRDFSDLPQTIQKLLDDPAKANRIATNSANLFRERYLTPAAEACYWRALIQTWAAVSHDVTRSNAHRKGLRYESFMLLGDSNMMHFVS